VLDAVGGVVLGQQAMLEQMLITLLAGGHALIEGVPGVAKTLAISALSRALDARFGRIQFTPDLMPTDVTGVNVLNELSHSFEFRRGPLFADLVLADEINRAPAKTQSALLEAMQERQVTVDGISHPLPTAFTVFASQNPIEYEGTYPLPEAQLDRFLLKIKVDYPAEPDEVAILDRYAEGFDASRPATFGLEPMLTGAELLELRELVARVRVEPEVRSYIVALVRQTRQRPALSLGASPRAAVALFRAAQACALLGGRDFVIPEDVKHLVVAALRHRVLLAAEAEVEGASADAELAGVVAAVSAPR
jgi:MoxR-like ATPase